jgi:hypothetical protein
MKTKTIARLVVLICGGLLVIGVVLWTRTFFSAYEETAKAVSPRIDSLFARGKIDPFAEAYLTHTTPELRAAVSQKKWQQIEDAIEARLGRLDSKALTQLNVKQANASTVVDAVYDAWFEKGNGTISVRYKVVAEQWLLDKFSVDSPLLPNDEPAKDGTSARPAPKADEPR